jgi:hypothetical protein
MSSITSDEVEWVFGVMKNGDGASLARVGNHRHMLIASDDVEMETGGRGVVASSGRHLLSVSHIVGHMTAVR